MRIRGIPGVLRAALAFGGLLASLTFVIWRQSEALDVLRAHDEVRTERAILNAERARLVRRIQRLESRARVVPAAREQLDMHIPSGSEIVILPAAQGEAE